MRENKCHCHFLLSSKGSYIYTVCCRLDKVQLCWCPRTLNANKATGAADAMGGGGNILCAHIH